MNLSPYEGYFHKVKDGTFFLIVNVFDYLFSLTIITINTHEGFPIKYMQCNLNIFKSTSIS